MVKDLRVSVQLVQQIIIQVLLQIRCYGFRIGMLEASRHSVKMELLDCHQKLQELIIMNRNLKKIKIFKLKFSAQIVIGKH